MFSGPLLEIDLEKIKQNAARVVERCHRRGIKVLGVSKGFNAIPEIVSAMFEGGLDGLADARLENIVDLRRMGFQQEVTLLRIPRLSNARLVTRYVNTSVNSELVTIRALARSAQELKKIHNVILMVDVGDLREGVMPEQVLETAHQICALRGVRLLGLGTNMGCYGGILPTKNNLGVLLELAEDIENLLGVKLEVISGGGTSSLLLVENGTVPPGINQIRVGEGILLGTDTTHDREISWLHQDAFRLRAEVIELKDKPSIPIGTVGRDAFGNIPSFVDRGIRKRAILALGKQDVPPEGIRPVDENVHILGGSSDHLIVDVTDSERKVEVGSDIAFFPNYPGLLYLSGSRYVKKIFKGGKQCWNWYRENSQSASGASSRLKPRLSAAEALTSGR